MFLVMGNQQEFTEWLQKAMLERGWSQADLSAKSGISEPHISKIVNGRRKIGVDACNAIAKAFNMPPEQVLRIAGLIDQAPGTEGQDITIGEWIMLYMMSTPEERERMLAQARAQVEYERRRKEAGDTKANSPAD